MATQDIDPAALIIAGRLREAIRDAGLTQRKLARELAGKGASPKKLEAERRNVVRWAGGEAKPDHANAERLAQKLGVSEELFRVSKAEAANVLVDLQERVTTLEAQLAEIEQQLRELLAARGLPEVGQVVDT